MDSYHENINSKALQMNQICISLEIEMHYKSKELSLKINILKASAEDVLFHTDVFFIMFFA